MQAPEYVLEGLTEEYHVAEPVVFLDRPLRVAGRTPSMVRLALATDGGGEKAESWHPGAAFHAWGGKGLSGQPEPGDTLYLYFPTWREGDLDAGLNVLEAIPLIGESVATGRASSVLNKGTKMIESMRYTFRATGDLEELFRGIRETLDQLDAAMGAKGAGKVKFMLNGGPVSPDLKIDVKIVDKEGNLIEHISRGGKGGSGAGSTPKTPSQEAQSWQGSGKYPGVDRYRDMTLKKGKIIYRGEPNGTNYFTTKSAIERSDLDARKIFEGLQVEENPIHGYRGTMQGYQTTKDLDAAFGITKANPQFGKGGLPQIFLPNIDELISKGYLVPADTIPLAK